MWVKETKKNIARLKNVINYDAVIFTSTQLNLIGMILMQYFTPFNDLVWLRFGREKA
jgi:hypothetical protein